MCSDEVTAENLCSDHLVPSDRIGNYILELAD
jgi:hypothetical protein